jgi:hypothetical protein
MPHSGYVSDVYRYFCVVTPSAYACDFQTTWDIGQPVSRYLPPKYFPAWRLENMSDYKLCTKKIRNRAVVGDDAPKRCDGIWDTGTEVQSEIHLSRRG